MTMDKAKYRQILIGFAIYLFTFALSRGARESVEYLWCIQIDQTNVPDAVPIIYTECLTEKKKKQLIQ